MDSWKLSDLDDYLRKFTLQPALLMIGRTSLSLFEKGKPIEQDLRTKVHVTQVGLAFLAYRLIWSSNDGRRDVFNEEALLRSMSIYNNLDEPFANGDRDLLGFLGRMSQEQFWWQEGISHDFARNYLLLAKIAQEPAFRNQMDLSSLA
jgi:hypothetical protein